MTGSIIGFAIGFLLVLEGILPFLSPRIWRFTLQQVFILSDMTVRLIGLASMLIGLGIVLIVHNFF